MQHALSILLATYSGTSCLPAPLDSLLDQIHADWQLLVRDDGFTVLGQGAAFLERYRDRLTPAQREMPEVYARLDSFNGLRRRWYLLKYRFFYTGSVRNMGRLVIG